MKVTKLTKKGAEKLIDLLSNKEPTFGCLVQREDWDGKVVKIIARSQDDNPPVYHAVGLDGEGDCFVEPGLFDKIIGHPVLVGDVLKRLEGKWGLAEMIINRWNEFGIDKSLNQIIEDHWGDRKLNDLLELLFKIFL